MKRAALLFFLYLPFFLFSQSDYLPLNRDFLSCHDQFFNKKNADFHPSVKPYLRSEIGTYEDSVGGYVFVPFLLKNASADSVKVSPKKRYAGVSPLFSIEPGYDVLNKQSNFTLEGGFYGHFGYGEKFYTEYRYYGGNSTFLSYQDTAIKYSEIVPGMGAGKSSKAGYKYHTSSGYISFSPNKIFNFQAGKDKNFWGDGYRSLFLSDNAIAYPFFKISTSIWKIKYVSLFAWHKEIGAIPGVSKDKNKFGTFHYLSWNATKRLNFSFFESIVWQGEDSNRYRGFDVHYLNPVIFFRPVEYSLGSSDNALIGFGFKAKLPLKSQLYGQLLLDEFLLKEIRAGKNWWGNKYALQLGLRLFDLFRIKALEGRGELNYVRPYTYSHGSVQQNYGHFNQSLAHPLGANFIEAIGVLSYRHKNWLMEGKLITAVYGADSAGENMGHDIFQSYTSRPRDYTIITLQGVQTRLFIASAHISYLVVPEINLQLSAGVLIRSEVPADATMKRYDNTFVFLRLSTALWNEQRDY